MKKDSFVILFLFFSISCVARQMNDDSYTTLEEPANFQKETDVTFAKKYGYNSECLVLMEGPVPSRLEPCIVGDVRSASMMYKESETNVKGETAQFEWKISGAVYSPFVNEAYYQNFILYRGSFFRKSDEEYDRRSEIHTIFPYLSRPSYRYLRGGRSR